MRKLLNQLNKLFVLLIGVFVFSQPAFAGTCEGFDYPAGVPDGVGYKKGEKIGGNDGWGFLEWNGAVWHPGEDWNRGTGETDYGDPLYAVGDGRVVVAGDLRGTWGRMVLIEHEFKGSKIWSQYAHLSGINVSNGQVVQRGQQVGKIGNADGKWASHLHFEMRKTELKANYWPAGLSRSQVDEKYLDPSKFIEVNRPPEAQVLTATPGSNTATLTWTKSDSPEFSKYEIYRAETTVHPVYSFTIYNGT